MDGLMRNHRALVMTLLALATAASGCATTRSGGGGRVGQVVSVPGLPGAKKVWIPPGSFTMGSPKSEPLRYGNEGPQTRVRLRKGFWLWRTEVTQGQFRRLMRYNPSRFKSCGTDCPVEQVSWHESAAFCNALSRKQRLPRCFSCSGSGRSVKCSLDGAYRGNGGKDYLKCGGFRLPTEAEWEYAARGGTTGSRYGDLGRIAWHRGNAGSRTHPAAGKAANPWGLHDMLGNVWEWAFDGWNGKHAGGSATDPVRSAVGASSRVFRGGSWIYDARYCRAALRYWYTPGYRYFTLGFRPARSGRRP